MPQGKGFISPDSGVSLQVLSNNHLGPVFGVVLCLMTGLVGLVGSGGGLDDFFRSYWLWFLVLLFT